MRCLSALCLLPVLGASTALAQDLPVLDCSSASWHVTVSGTGSETAPVVIQIDDADSALQARVSQVALGVSLDAPGLSVLLRKDGGVSLERAPNGSERLIEEATCSGRDAFLTRLGENA